VSKELWPFYTARAAALLIVPYVPAATLWLPSFIGP
jgi:TRAP-type C4-dicarboxylate transport system permease large subunit